MNKNKLAFDFQRQAGMRRFLPAIAAIGALVFTGLATNANAATFIWSGGLGSLNSTNYDTGTSPFNATADVVNITDGGQRAFTNNFGLEGVDTYNLSDGGVIQNRKGGNKVITANGATINVGSGGILGAPNRLDNATVNLTSTGVLLIGNDGENILPQLSGGSIANLDPAWTGEVYFAAQDTFDEVSEFLTWLDTTGANKFFVSGVALTSSDLNSKFDLTLVAPGSGNEPTFATDDAGISLTLSAIPEPGSAALLGLALGLGFFVRRRRG